ncbi:MAG: SPOR domain-containing protein [Pseudomonadota bacterium]|nr:SPOR domain-containing protein [Pseudomonadota bacterium]
MKWLIYVLILLNLSLFAWHYRADSGNPSAGEALPADVQRLVLLREQREPGEDEEPVWCYSLGSLKETGQVEALAQRLQQWGISGWQRKSQEAGRKGYWVILPPRPSRSEARAAVEQLKAKNIEDYFLIATGDKANGVSLGVFSSFEAAHRRINQLAELGFDAIWEDVKLPVEEYWFDWRRDSGDLSAEQLARLRQDYPDLKKVERACQPPK